MIAIAPIKSLPDGSVATIPMGWADYEQLMVSRGNQSIPRLKYANRLTLVSFFPILRYQDFINR